MEYNKTQKEKDEYGYNWRVEYVALLEEKLSILNAIIQSPTNSSFQESLKVLDFKIAAKELEHNIFWKKIALSDYLQRVQRHEMIKEKDYEEATKLIDDIVSKAKSLIGNNNYDEYGRKRLIELLEKENLIDKKDAESLTAYYKTIKLEISKLEN